MILSRRPVGACVRHVDGPSSASALEVLSALSSTRRRCSWDFEVFQSAVLHAQAVHLVLAPLAPATAPGTAPGTPFSSTPFWTASSGTAGRPRQLPSPRGAYGAARRCQPAIITIKAFRHKKKPRLRLWRRTGGRIRSSAGDGVPAHVPTLWNRDTTASHLGDKTETTARSMPARAGNKRVNKRVAMTLAPGGSYWCTDRNVMETLSFAAPAEPTFVRALASATCPCTAE